MAYYKPLFNILHSFDDRVATKRNEALKNAKKVN